MTEKVLSSPVTSAGGSALSFQFGRDTFAFANELVWEYRFAPGSGAVTIQRNHPPPTYAHRCFVVARSARQFLYHARFDATVSAANETLYREKIREVVSRSPRRPGAERERVVIPGYRSLRQFSEAHEQLLKTECGGAWQSYVLRSHWRMILPITRRHQERLCRQLTHALTARPAPIVHLFRFPKITINHAVVLFDRVETPSAIRFQAYDPNVPAQPTELIYDREEQRFHFPPNHYWPGGRLNVVEVYCSWLY